MATKKMYCFKLSGLRGVFYYNKHDKVDWVGGREIKKCKRPIKLITES